MTGLAPRMTTTGVIELSNSVPSLHGTHIAETSSALIGGSEHTVFTQQLPASSVPHALDRERR